MSGRDDGAWRAARRAVARAHHPDLGGDVAVYLRELAAVDAAHGRDADGRLLPGRVFTAQGRADELRRTIRMVQRGSRRAYRLARAHLPAALRRTWSGPR